MFFKLNHLDIAITTLSIYANYLLVRKVKQAWNIWIIVDIMSVVLFLSQELYFTTLLYATFFVLAVSGKIKWDKKWKEQKSLRTD